jgi:hypothetical protein
MRGRIAQREQNSRYAQHNGVRFFADCAAKKGPFRGSRTHVRDTKPENRPHPMIYNPQEYARLQRAVLSVSLLTWLAMLLEPRTPSCCQVRGLKGR